MILYLDFMKKEGTWNQDYFSTLDDFDDFQILNQI
jgi:hypothetical protein